MCLTVSARVKSRKTTPVQQVDVCAWLCEDGTERFLKALSRKYIGFARCDVEDLTSEVVVAILEQKADAPAGDAKFAEWVDAVAEQTATRLGRVERSQLGVGMDGDVLAELAVEESTENESEFEFCEQLVAHEQRLRNRVKRQLAKLSVKQQDVIRAKYFSNVSLNHFAADRGKCDSADRMNLLRAKSKLASLLDHRGYAKR